MLSQTLFDVFAGTVGDLKNSTWIECAESLENAKAFMRQRAEKRPGPYYVWNGRTGEMEAQLDTSVPESRKE